MQTHSAESHNHQTNSETNTNTNDTVREVLDKAITPMRRPHPSQGRYTDQYVQEQQTPADHQSSMMAPRREGIWSFIPYIAAAAALGVTTYFAGKRFQARQKRLVRDFGEVVIYYGNDLESMQSIVKEYKWKLGPGVLRGGMFKSFLRNLVTEKAVGPVAISDARFVQKLLRIDNKKASKLIGEVGKELKREPSVLGKLLFLADRLLPAEQARDTNLLPLFPYGEDTVEGLQKNMLERCYREIATKAIDQEDAEGPPMREAEVLKVNSKMAQQIFDSVLLSRRKERELEKAAVEAIEAEEAGKPDVGDLDYPARSAEPAKITSNAYQCTVCGYTMFPAAGREFKFYGDDFVCPTCGSDKSKFINLADG